LGVAYLEGISGRKGGGVGPPFSGRVSAPKQGEKNNLFQEKRTKNAVATKGRREKGETDRYDGEKDLKR